MGLAVVVKGQRHNPNVLLHISTDVVRCHRLNKECHPSATVRRRNPKKPVVTKSSRLEEKLDGLVSLLKAGAQSGATAVDAHATVAMYDPAHYSNVRTIDETFPHSQTGGGSVTSVLDNYPPNLPVLTTVTTASDGTSCNSPASVLHDATEPSPVEAEQYLTTFHNHKSKYFPFVYIPPTTTAQQLRQERPFLWLCIMTIASRSTSQQQVLGSKIRHMLAQEMLLKSGQNIDLLLGLLAYTAWYGILSHKFESSYTESSLSGPTTKWIANLLCPYLLSLPRPWYLISVLTSPCPKTRSSRFVSILKSIRNYLQLGPWRNGEPRLVAF